MWIVLANLFSGVYQFIDLTIKLFNNQVLLLLLRKKFNDIFHFLKLANKFLEEFFRKVFYDCQEAKRERKTKYLNSKQCKLLFFIK